MGTVAGVQVQRVAATGLAVADPAVTPASLTGLTTSAANGSIVLYTLNGVLTVDQAISAIGSGNVRIETRSTGANDKDVVLNATVSSGSGSLSIIANNSLTQSAAGDLQTGEPARLTWRP